MDGPMVIRSMSRMKALVNKQANLNAALNRSPVVDSKLPNKKSRVVEQMNQNFIFNTEPEAEECVKDRLDIMLEDYIRKSKACRTSTKCPLDFWKINESVYPELACLARKYLSIQASSGACERIFSLAGHIYQPKRRRLGISIFSDLVFLKLNEDLLD